MEPDLVPYSPILHRPPLRWPGDARVALWIVPNIEHYEYLPAFPSARAIRGRARRIPTCLATAQRDYGNRVGLWRLFELTTRLHYVAPSASAWRCCSISRKSSAQWSSAAGVHVARHLQHALPLEFHPRGRARRDEEELKDIHLHLTGRRLRGWFSPAITNTLEHVRTRRRRRASITPPICTTTTSRSRSR